VSESCFLTAPFNVIGSRCLRLRRTTRPAATKTPLKKKMPRAQKATLRLPAMAVSQTTSLHASNQGRPASISCRGQLERTISKLSQCGPCGWEFSLFGEQL
jgi:hypothetical protein